MMSEEKELRELVERCASAYREWRGRAPSWVAWAPGRVNLIGEHTDYNGGYVLPMAIDRWCVAAGSLCDGVDGEVRTSGLPGGDLGVQYRADVAEAGALAMWARYAVGALWVARHEAITAGRQARAIDAMVCSNLPVGAGLSSSAAVEVAMARLGCELWEVCVSPERLAAMAREAENRYAGVPCGIMDQMASACGVAGGAIAIDCQETAWAPVALAALGDVAFVVADSGVRRSLADGRYAAARRACERAAAKLGAESLRGVFSDQLEGARAALDEEAFGAARHVVGENSRVLRFIAAARSGMADVCGRLMAESHASLRDDFRVSCPELDEMVQAAMGVEGVHGSRMTGAGFGGCTVTLCRRGAMEEVIRVLEKITQPRGALRPFEVRAVAGAGSAEYQAPGGLGTRN